MSGNGRVSRADMAKLDSALLHYIAERAPRGTSAEISVRSLSEHAKQSAFRVKSSASRLEKDGLIARSERYDEDGGRRANAYTVTEAGWQTLGK